MTKQEFKQELINGLDAFVEKYINNEVEKRLQEEKRFETKLIETLKQELKEIYNEVSSIYDEIEELEDSILDLKNETIEYIDSAISDKSDEAGDIRYNVEDILDHLHQIDEKFTPQLEED